MASENQQFDIQLISSSGIPSFSFSYGKEPLPLAITGTLFGIQSFCKSNQSQIHCAAGKDTQVVWKCFDEDVMVVSAKYPFKSLPSYLEFIYSAMVFYVGMDTFQKSKSQELLRKDLKACTPLVSWIVKGIMQDNNRELMADATLASDCMVPSDQTQLQQLVTDFASQIQSFYVCVLASYRIAAATADWWSLTGIEMALIVGFLRVGKEAKAKDVPVFLHKKSPNMPVRLVWCRISLNCILVALCGPNPTMDVFLDTAKKTFQSVLPLLRNAEATYPYNVPPAVILDTVVLGYLVVNRETNRCLNSFCPHRQPVRFPFPVQTVLTPHQRMKVLRDAIRHLISVNQTEHHESFKRYSDHLCYYIRTQENYSVCLFPAETPVQTARLTTIKTMKTIDGLLTRT